MMELQVLFLTAFVAIIFSFLIARLVSVAVSAANGEFAESGKKGIDEIVKLDRGLKVGGAKSKKRVRFAVDQVVEKVEKFSGEEEGLVGEVEELGGVKGGDLVICLEGKKGEEGNMVNKELGRVIGSGGKLGSDEQSWEVVRALEELGGDENRENVGGDELVENSGLDELVFTERNESEVRGDEESVRFVSGDEVDFQLHPYQCRI